MGDVKPLLLITGTRREGSAVAGLQGVTVLAGGSDAQGLEARLEQALTAQDGVAHDGVAQGAAGIISFGMGGALAPDLKLGDWVIGSRVIGAVEAPCDADWQARLLAAFPQAHSGSVYADGRLIADVAEKRVLHAQYGAVLADMESHISARVALRHGLPFAVLRCVSDEAASALPPAISVAMRGDGSIAPGAMLGSILAQPGQVAALVSTGLRFNRAYRVMARGAQAALLALR